MNFAPAPTATCGLPVTARPQPRLVPFDQVVTFNLTGKPGNILNQVTTISAEGNFIAMAISYSLLPELQVRFGPLFDISSTIFFGNLRIRDVLRGFEATLQKRGIPSSQFAALEEKLFRIGVQVNPQFDAVANPGGRLDNWGEGVDQLFQIFSCPEGKVDFLYRLIDNATGREFQSEPIHNIAGLGIANGDRPFRFFPQPLVFTPRSVIRVEITEISGTGRLYFVLQGHKVLATS